MAPRPTLLRAALALSSLLPPASAAGRAVDLPPSAASSAGRSGRGILGVPTTSALSSTPRRGRGLLSSSPSALTTGYGGTVPSPAVEFDVSSTSSGRGVALTGLSVHVLTVGPDGTGVRGDRPCRVRVHTRRRGGTAVETASELASESASETASGTAVGTPPAEGGSPYELVLDSSEVVCRGEGMETVVPDGLFAAYGRSVGRRAQLVNTLDVQVFDAPAESVEAAAEPEVSAIGAEDDDGGSPGFATLSPGERLTIYVAVSSPEGSSGDFRFDLVSTNGAASDASPGTAASSGGLVLHEGRSILQGSAVDSGYPAGTAGSVELEAVSPTTFDGSVRYVVLGGTAPPTSPGGTDNFYESAARESGMCPASSELISSYADGSGSYGALFDVVALDDVTLRGIDLNVDWHTGDEADVVVYARKGGWFGMQGEGDEWTHLLANATLARPDGFVDDGPMTAKLRSAMVPREEFAPLAMVAGETWGLYVCMSNADMRYTVGTKVGSTVSASPQLRILEGAGAANYPPFRSGTPEGGGVDYTYYAPRVFNGRLHYDHVRECPTDGPSGAPSAAPSSGAPTASPDVVETAVSYAFYVEHDPDRGGELVRDGMADGTRKALAGLVSGTDAVLTGYAEDDGLDVVSVATRVITPREIGYICVPTPPQLCLPVSVDVKVTHNRTVSTEDVTYALLRHSASLPRLISGEVAGNAKIEYVGERAVETESRVTLSRVPGRKMGEGATALFEGVVRDFLSGQGQASDGPAASDGVDILSVTVNDQTIGPPGQSSAYSTGLRDSAVRRRLAGSSNDIDIRVRGKYTPPPELDFGRMIEDSINANGRRLEEQLKKPSLADRGANAAGLEDLAAAGSYFEEVVVERAVEIRRRPASVIADEQGASGLGIVAASLGVMILVLSSVFFLRPKRREVIFRSRSEAQPLNATESLGGENLDHLGIGGKSKQRYKPRLSFSKSLNNGGR